MTTQHIFLDLEQTVIDTWDSQCLINIERVSGVLKDHFAIGKTVMHIFSFAIWNDEDERNFRSDLEVRLMEALGLHTRFIVHSVDQIGSDLFRSTKVCWERNELITCLGKQGAFTDFCRAKFDRNVHCILLDDMVINSVTVDTDFSRIIQTVRI
jgi:hypothetical protein